MSQYIKGNKFMKNLEQEFRDKDDLNDYLEENFNIQFKETISRDSSDLTLTETPKSLIVSFLSVDDDAQDFWESSDGLGTFKEFYTPSQRKDYLSSISKNKLVYLVDKYDHGSVHYSVAQTQNYPDQRFDVAHGKAVFIPCDYIQKEYKKYKKEHGEVQAYKQFLKDINSVLDDYSKWCNGEVYGYQVFELDKKGNQVSEDACWGFVGHEYALKEKKSIVASIVSDEKIEEFLKEVVINKLEAQSLKDLPFKVSKKGFLEGSIADVYDNTFVTVKYEDKAIVYKYNEQMEKPLVAKYSQIQKDYGVTPEQFLQNRMTSDIKDAIREKLKETSLEKNTTPTI